MKKNTFWLSVACMLTASFQLTIAGETAKEKPYVPQNYTGNSQQLMVKYSSAIPKNLQPVSAQTLENSKYPQPAPHPPVMVKPVVEAQPTAKSEKALKPALTLYSHGDPTPEEQLILEYINRARSNPKEEGIRIATTKDADLLQAFSYWKVNLTKLKNDFASYPVQPPLAFNSKIITAARLHSDWMVETGIQDHTGRNGSSPFDRMNAAGYTGWSSAGENIFKDASSPWYGHAGFLVDWGPTNEIELGHRRNCLNFDGSVFKEIGIGITKHSGKMAITEDFGARDTSFICGVVYKDNNNNGFYDIGEGLSGVTITPSKGNFYAVTSTSGGYAISIAPGTTGSITIEAKGGALGSTVVKNAVLSGQNVKVDFTSPLPGQVSLEYPGLSELLAKKAVTFRWYKSPGNVSAYWFELADNEDFLNPIVTNQALTDTMIDVKDLKNGTTYYWHVKAQTGAGWGDFSLANDFTITIIPGQVELTSENVTSTKNDTYTIAWKKGDSTITRYLVQLAVNNDVFIDEFMAVNDSSVVETTSYTFKNLKYDSTYFYRVAAMNDALWGEFSEVRTFTRLLLPDKGQQVYPADGFTTKNPGVRFGWKSTPNNDTYWLQIAYDAEMKKLVFNDSALKDTSKLISVLQRGNTYYWRVRASNYNGWGDFSDVRSITIETAGGVQEDYIAQAINLTASPNPTSGDVAITFELPTPQVATLSILNPLGQTMTVLSNGMQSGKQVYVWNADNAAQGMYYYQLRFGNSVLTYPIVLVR
ncbi:MAG: fibronectin type III domain-containing protein [Candidatus Kapaibacterium sp.]